MHTESIPLDETHCFSSFFLDYINQKPELNSFHSGFPSIEGFKHQIEKRNFNDAHRMVLVEVLAEQYEEVEKSATVKENIELLSKNNTYTVTTGHQLNIFTGPLYFLYKIITTVNTCERLKKQYPEYNFVPIYWMASEDHDFEEINHFFYNEKKIEWKTNQSGGVGRFDPNDLLEICKQLPDEGQFFEEAYSKSTLAEACRYYVNHLFDEHGLLVLDADHRKLKQLFEPVIQEDILKQSVQGQVNRDTERLESLGYKTQLYCREINFFYLDDQLRSRIEKKGDEYEVLDSSLKFSQSEMEDLIQNQPEKLSPNVILRPLYQETILPNLAYIGGPSEVIYWFQLKSLFQYFDTPFPLLMPRNFALIFPSGEQEKWKKTSLTTGDLFLKTEEAYLKWVQVHSSSDLNYSEEEKQIKEVYDQMILKSGKVDPTLQQHLEALKTIATNKIQKAEKKLIRSEKRKHQEKEKQIQQVKDKLFPNGSLQERRTNFLDFYFEDPKFVQKISNLFDPFDYQMQVIHL